MHESTPSARSTRCPVVLCRDGELDAIDQSLAWVADGRGQIAILAGEAGIGKSRLVAEARRRAEQRGFRVLEGRCFETDVALPFAPLVDLLQTRLEGISSEELLAELGPTALELSRLLPELIALVPGLTPRVPADPAEERQRLFGALTRFVLGPLGAQPGLVVLEDLHWSDAPSLEFLLVLARRVAAHRLLLLLTYRSDEVGPSLRHFLAELDRGRLAREYALRPLDRSGVAAMLRAIFGPGRRVRADVVDALAALTDGNPFFVEEVLSTSASDATAPGGTGAAERAFPDPLAVPRSVHDAVVRRLVRLSPSAQRAVTLASVAGQRFDFSLLQELTGSGEGELLELVKELVATQLVVEESSEHFAFRHALTRQAIYARLLARERLALHRTIVETLERLDAELPESRLPDLAHHSHAAHLWEKSLLYARRMAERAQAMHAPQAAIEHLGRALEAAQQLGATPSPDLHRARGQAHELRGVFELAREDFTRALELARSSGDRGAEWRGLLDLGFLWLARDWVEAGDFFRRALVLAEQLDDPTRLAQSLNRLGNWHVNMDQPGRGRALHERALGIFRGLGDPPGIAETLDLLAVATYVAGDRRGAISRFGAAVACFRGLDEQRGLASVLATLAHLRCSSRVYDTLPGAAPAGRDALAEVREALAITRRIGWRSGEAYACCELAACLSAAGEYGRALAAAHEGLAIAEEIEHREWLSIAHATLGVVHLDLLDPVAARQHCEYADAEARASGSRHIIGIAAALLGSACLLEGDAARAVALLQDAVTPESPVETLTQSVVLAVLAEARLARGDPGQALRIAEDLIAWTDRIGGAGVVPRLWRLRGEALAELGATTEAEGVLRAAADAAREQEARPLLWPAQLALGRLLRRTARRDDAERALGAARETLDELVATVPDERLRAGFRERALTRFPPPRPTSPRRAEKQHYGGLTVREREVAVLIARGLSNRQIADALVVSERTVEAHTGHIRDKLGLTSRVQVAAWAVERGLAEAVEEPRQRTPSSRRPT